jgi:hypothetical protein
MGNPLKIGGSGGYSPWDSSPFGGERGSPSKKQIRENESQEKRIQQNPIFLFFFRKKKNHLYNCSSSFLY